MSTSGRGSFEECTASQGKGFGFHVIDGCRTVLTRCRAEQNVAGWDIEASYRTDLAELQPSLQGSVDLRAVGSYLTKFTQTIGTTTTGIPASCAR